MHIKTALFGLNFDAFEYSWDETGGATRIGLALLTYVCKDCSILDSIIFNWVPFTDALNHLIV